MNTGLIAALASSDASTRLKAALAIGVHPDRIWSTLQYGGAPSGPTSI